jgi:DNA topoisomerase I
MTNKLIIVESYTKTNTIKNYLQDKNFNVTFSQGHFSDLSKKSLGIDTNTWQGSYVITKNNILQNIIKYVKISDIIYIASDPDTEGEAIAFQIYKNIKHLINNKKCYRIKFNEVTKNAILNSINNPLDIDMNLVYAQETRRFLDRLVGFKLSPILWNKFNDIYLSVGRVQTIALVFCINIFNDINKHNANVFWNLTGKFKYNKLTIDCTSDKIVDLNEKEMINILNDLDNIKNIFDISIDLKDSTESPKPPYTTTTLQQDSYNILRFNSKKTMEIAQKLYENGIITYMRTDSVNISKEFKFKLKKYISDNYGSEYSVIRNFKNKIINSQEAHEAIRITNPNILDTDINFNDIQLSHKKLYNLIWKRTLACQMKNANYTNINISIKCTNNNKCDKYIFNSNKSFLIDIGFQTIYNKLQEDYTNYLNNFKTKSNISIIEFALESDINTPKSLYTEVSLIKKLEKEGIGRPSTYSSIIDKLYLKKYVIKGSNPSQTIITKNYIKKYNKPLKINDKNIKTGGTNKDLLVPTNLGINIIDYLYDIIPFLLNVDFTADMEKALDKISNGELNKKVVLTDFYNQILPIINKYSNDNINIEKKTGIIKSKYGYCYYNEETDKYTNIESFLRWKNKDADQLDNNEILFLASLPKKIDKETELHIGRYGLYIKNKGKNVKLDKSKWNTYIY